jgi:hypothetical protein
VERTHDAKRLFFVNFREYVSSVAVLDLKPGPLTLCGPLPLHDHLTMSAVLVLTAAGANR